MGEGRDMCLEGKFPIEHKKDTGAVIYIVSKREGERRLRGECNLPDRRSVRGFGLPADRDNPQRSGCTSVGDLPIGAL